MLNPYYENESGILFLGDSNIVIPQLANKSIDMVITSPPYWMARKYVSNDELGQEPDFRQYVLNLTRVFYELKPKMKLSGNLFVNISDTYFSLNKGNGGRGYKQDTNSGSFFDAPKLVSVIPVGALIGIPFLFRDQMVRSGWFHKHTLIWHKPNAFPTSNKKKFTLDYEYVFHFVINLRKYYFEQQFEPFTTKSNFKPRVDEGKPTKRPIDTSKNTDKGRNKRSVWSIPTKHIPGTHTATYPEELIETPIRACCPPGGFVLDPFFGSGTTAIVAQRLGKQWLGIELSEEYCAQAVERIENESKDSTS